MYAWFLFLRPGRCYLRISASLKRSSETLVDEFFKSGAGTHGIRDRYAKARALRGQQLGRVGLAQRRGIQADAGASDRGVGAPAKAQIQIDRVEDIRQRIAGMSQHLLAIDVVAHDDHVRLAAMQQPERYAGVGRVE